MAKPSTYSEKVAQKICDRIAEGEPLRQICRDERMPAWRTVYHWRSKNEEFAARLASARDMGADAIAEETIEIADDTSNDTIVTENGEKPNGEWIARSRLRVETRLKLLAKWSPKKYGEKIDVTSDGEKLSMTDEERSAKIAAIFARAEKRKKEGEDAGAAEPAQ